MKYSKLRFLLALNLLFLGVFLSFSFLQYLIPNERDNITDNFIDKYRAISAYLSSESGYAFITNDLILLSQLVAPLKKDPEILFAQLGERRNGRITSLIKYEKDTNIGLNPNVNILKPKDCVSKTVLGNERIILFTPVFIEDRSLNEEGLFLDTEDHDTESSPLKRCVGFLQLIVSLEQPQKEIAKSKRIIVYLIVGVVLLFMVINYFVTEYIFIRPIKRFILGVKKVEGGNMKHRFKNIPQNEIGQLMASFNEMTDSIEQKQEIILRQEKLSSIGKTAAFVVHEIKHGLQMILMKATRISMTTGGKAEEIENEVMRMSGQMDELLSFSTSKGIDKRNIMVNELYEYCFKVVLDSTKCEANKIEKISYIDTDVNCFVDKRKISVAITNLVRNSLDACGPDNTISFTVKLQDNIIQLIVADNGKGMKKDDISKSKELFHTTKSSSFGLGISIVEDVASAHDGTFSIDSVYEKGTIACLSIPLSIEK